jgi:hypothetical protein
MSAYATKISNNNRFIWRTFTLATSRHGWCPHRMAVPCRHVRVEPHLIIFTVGPLMHVRLGVHSSWALLIVTQSRPQKFIAYIRVRAFLRLLEALVLEGQRPSRQAVNNQGESV